MTESDVNRYPLQLLVNYWEYKPSLIGAHLDELLRRGVREIATFVPWQAVESDISHSLPRFLQAATERKMTVSLILTPELGLHFPNSGIPKELLSKRDQLAKTSDSQCLISALPPNVFKLPSFFSTEFTKRYYSFLSRMDGLLADLSRSQPGFQDAVKIWLSGSFWKYFKPSRACALTGYSGKAGDYSNPASLSFRQHMEQFFSQREFQEVGAQAANRWRSTHFEEMNRKAFFQQAEEVFRHRTYHQLRKKSGSLSVSEIELFTPEADPSLVYSRFLQTIGAGGGDFVQLSQRLDEMDSRIGTGCGAPGTSFSTPMVHWTGMGAFNSGTSEAPELSDAEKQFLILKSLLLVGGRGGAMLIDESQWFALKPAFRARVENYARHLSSGDLSFVTDALYLTPHLWSQPGDLWTEMRSALKQRVQLVSSLERALMERDAKLLVIDPSFIFTREKMLKLLAWARGGRVLVIPKTQHFTESARVELDKALAGTKSIQLALGISYGVHAMGDGRLIHYDASQLDQAPHQPFAAALISIADLEEKKPLSVDQESSVEVLSLRKRYGGRGLFILNASKSKVSVEVQLGELQRVSDLSQALAMPASVNSVEAERLSLEVPPCGILPLSVDPFPEPAVEVAPGISTELESHAEQTQSSGQESIWS